MGADLEGRGEEGEHGLGQLEPGQQKLRRQRVREVVLAGGEAGRIGGQEGLGALPLLGRELQGEGLLVEVGVIQPAEEVDLDRALARLARRDLDELLDERAGLHALSS